MAAGDDGGFDLVHAHRLADEIAGGDHGQHGADADDEVGDGEIGHHLTEGNVADAEADEQGIGEAAAHELVHLVRALFHAGGHDIEGLDERGGQDHDDRAGNANDRRQRQTEDKERAGDQQTGGHEREFDGRFLVLKGEKVRVFAGANEEALAADGWAFFSPLFQQTGGNDGHDVAEQGRRNELGDEDFLCLTGDLPVTHRQRQDAFADAPADDRCDDVEIGVPRIISEERRDEDANADGGDGPDDEGNEHLRKSEDQDFAVHAEDGAGDQTGNIDVEEIGAFHEGIGGVNHRFVHDAVKNERRGNEEGQDGGAADFVQEGNLLPEMAEEHPEGEDDGESADHVFRKFPGGNGGDDDRGDCEIDQKGHVPDLEAFHEWCDAGLFRRGAFGGIHGKPFGAEGVREKSDGTIPVDRQKPPENQYKKRRTHPDTPFFVLPVTRPIPVPACRSKGNRMWFNTFGPKSKGREGEGSFWA